MAIVRGRTRLLAAVVALAALAGDLVLLHVTAFRGDVQRLFLPEFFGPFFVGLWVAGGLAYVLLKPGAARARAQNLAVLSTSLALTIGVLELPAFLGVIDYRLFIAPSESVLFTQIKPWENPRSNVLDRELLHQHRPNLHFT